MSRIKLYAPCRMCIISLYWGLCIIVPPFLSAGIQMPPHKNTDSSRVYALAQLALQSAKSLPELSITYAQEALSYAERDKRPLLLAYSKRMLAAVYAKQGKYINAIPLFREALLVYEKESEKKELATTLLFLGESLAKTGNKREAETCFARVESSALHFKDYTLLKNVYESYSSYFERTGDYRNAYKYHVLLTEVLDSSASGDKENLLSPSLKKKRAFVSESSPASIKEDLKSKTRSAIFLEYAINNFVWFVSLFVALLAVLLWSRYKFKRKAEIANQQLERQEMNSKTVLAADERERSKIAHELQDGIGQHLSVAKLTISALQTALKDKEGLNEQMLQTTANLLDDSVKEVRNVSGKVISNTLIKSGFIAAVRELVQKVNSGGTLNLQLEVIGMELRMDATKETILFKIVQEIIQNIVKHAQATQATIQIIRYEHEVSVLVEDNGIGFDAQSEMNQNRGIGLAGIQSRVNFLNGLVFFDSRANRGTSITIEIPV